MPLWLWSAVSIATELKFVRQTCNRTARPCHCDQRRPAAQGDGCRHRCCSNERRDCRGIESCIRSRRRRRPKCHSSCRGVVHSDWANFQKELRFAISPVASYIVGHFRDEPAVMQRIAQWSEIFPMPTAGMAPPSKIRKPSMPSMRRRTERKRRRPGRVVDVLESLHGRRAEGWLVDRRTCKLIALGTVHVGEQIGCVSATRFSDRSTSDFPASGRPQM